MKLEGVMKGEEYYPACETHKGTLAKLDAIVREIAQKAIDDYSDCANTESEV